MKTSCIFLLFFVSSVLYSQDSIVGIYALYDDELTFRIDGIFEATNSNFHFEEPFNGNGIWERVNDTTVYIKLDTTIKLVDFYDDIYFNDFYCSQYNNTNSIYCYFYYRKDSINHKHSYRKIGTFHYNGFLKSEKRYLWTTEIITNYHPNGKIEEIIEYEMNKRNGLYLRYDLNGKLLVKQHWTNGTLCDKDSPKNKNEKECLQSTEIVTTYHPNGRAEEVIEYRKKKQNGLYSRYKTSGRLLIYEHWRKGKLIRKQVFD